MSPFCEIPSLLGIPSSIPFCNQGLHIVMEEGKELGLKLGFLSYTNTPILQNWELWGETQREPHLHLPGHALSHWFLYFKCRRPGLSEWLPEWILRLWLFRSLIEVSAQILSFYTIPENFGIDYVGKSNPLICLFFIANWFSVERHLIVKMKFVHSPWYVNSHLNRLMGLVI